jgi:hypothetical protein
MLRSWDAERSTCSGRSPLDEGPMRPDALGNPDPGARGHRDGPDLRRPERAHSRHRPADRRWRGMIYRQYRPSKPSARAVLFGRMQRLASMAWPPARTLARTDSTLAGGFLCSLSVLDSVCCPPRTQITTSVFLRMLSFQPIAAPAGERQTPSRRGSRARRIHRSDDHQRHGTGHRARDGPWPCTQDHPMRMLRPTAGRPCIAPYLSDSGLQNA